MSTGTRTAVLETDLRQQMRATRRATGPFVYTRSMLGQMFRGESQHMFNRAGAPQDGSSRRTVALSGANAASLADTFFCIVVDYQSHTSAPTELWISENIAYLQANSRRPIPAFVQRKATDDIFEFVGCYRIKRWELYQAGSPEVKTYVDKRRLSQTEKREIHWTRLAQSNWAKVEVEEVVDPVLSGSRKHRYVLRKLRYAMNIAGRVVA